MSAYVNVFRYIRLQLKTGYLKVEPDEYRFLLRYPPMSRSSPSFREVKPETIPYMHLYSKIMSENPVLRDETVYPAYWQEEPVALTLAKKQYEMMQKGFSEESALREAQKYVNTLENDAYENMIKVKRIMADKISRDSYLTDINISNEIAKWRGILKITPYDELPLGDQGEIDHFVQTKLLNWREVERERRMKDPVFNWQFERLREQVFPEMFEDRLKSMTNKRDVYKKELMQAYDVDVTGLVTQSPFYYEDYMILFNKLRERPHLARWNERHRDNLAKWIIETLGFQSILKSQSPGLVQSYLDQLRSQYFPMIKYPADALSFNLPSPDKVKEILYANGIGYKTEEGKLYIKRFYRLPALLFPKQTWTTQLLNDRSKLRYVLTDKKVLLKELRTAGFDDVSKEEIEKKIMEYVRKQGIDVDLPSYNQPMDETATLMQMAKSEDIVLGHSTTKPLTAALPNDADKPKVSEESVAIASDEIINEVNARILNEKYPVPTNRLERDRDAFINLIIPGAKDIDRNESNLSSLQTTILSSEVILGARLGMEYEDKEAARRSRDWEKRGVLEFDQLESKPTVGSEYEE